MQYNLFIKVIMFEIKNKNVWLFVYASDYLIVIDYSNIITIETFFPHNYNKYYYKGFI